jgi:cobalt-zinc-cadmium efflux system protein
MAFVGHTGRSPTQRRHAAGRNGADIGGGGASVVSWRPEVHGLPVLIVSGVTMSVSLVGAGVLGAAAANEDLHMRSVLLDTLADAAVAAAVAIAGAVIALTGRFFWLDPALTLVVAVVVTVPVIALCRKAVAAMRGAEADFSDG